MVDFIIGWTLGCVIEIIILGIVIWIMLYRMRHML